jgi:hypothetical protein
MSQGWEITTLFEIKLLHEFVDEIACLKGYRGEDLYRTGFHMQSALERILERQ